MDRVNRIMKHKLYLEYINRIKAHEQDRIFCKHDMGHFLDVCRLAEIEWLTFRIQETETKQDAVSNGQSGVKNGESIQVNRELIYAAGLLHDIGRWEEYENGVRHEIASAGLAPGILRECDFAQRETEEIIFAISNHRNKEIKEENSLAGFLYRADKKSRACFSCEAENECDWSDSKKNLEIK